MGKEYKTDKERFSDLLDKFPRLAGFWDRSDVPSEWSCDVDRVLATGGVLSRAEGVILDCLVAIWLGGLHAHTEDFKIDFTDLYAWIDPHDRKHLIAWLNDPYWP